MIISIIIPTIDNVSKTDRTVSSLLSDKHFLMSDYEILIVNDGASPEIKNYVEEKSKNQVNIKCINISESKGAYYARNQAIKQAKGEYIGFFDAALEVPSNWYTDLKDNLSNYDYIAGDVKVEAKNEMTIGEKIDYVKAFPIKSYLENDRFGVTAFLIVKKSIFDHIGYFDESHSGGDGEFGKRVYEYGFKQVYYDKAPALHPPRTFKQQYYKKIRDYKGILEMNQKYPDKYPNKPTSIRSIFNCFTAIPANIFKFRTNKVYKSGLFTFPEYCIGVICFWGIEAASRMYVWFNRNKIIGTKL